MGCEGSRGPKKQHHGAQAEEDLEQNKIVEEQKKKLQEAENENGWKAAFRSVFLQQLDQLSTTFSRAVDEAVAELSKEKFRIDAPDLPNGVQSRLHLAVSDASGDSAIFEYRDGKLEIHHGRQYQVMTNSPFYDDQLAILGYWQQIGGLTMLPGTNRSSDRFVRASFYIEAVVQSADPAIAVPAVMSVMRNVSVPYGISTPDMPHIASTRWRTVCDQKNRVCYFEPTLGMEVFRVDLRKVDFAPGSGERVLRLTEGQSYSGDVTAEFRSSEKPFGFLFGV